MTNPLTTALRAQIDQRTADYIDAALADLERRLMDRVVLAAHQGGRADAHDHEGRIAALEHDLKLRQADDKYRLSKAQLVRFMREQGWLAARQRKPKVKKD